jgi:hypothetical protein
MQPPRCTWHDAPGNRGECRRDVGDGDAEDAIHQALTARYQHVVARERTRASFTPQMPSQLVSDRNRAKYLSAKDDVVNRGQQGRGQSQYRRKSNERQEAG